jgi:hypothetical protein
MVLYGTIVVSEGDVTKEDTGNGIMVFGAIIILLNT